MRAYVRPGVLAGVMLATLGPAPLPAAEPAPAPIAASPLSQKELPAWVKVQGRLERALGWTDKNGRNVVVFTTTESSRRRGEDRLLSYALTVEHQVESGGQVRLLRAVRDRVEKCELDLVGRVVPESIGVTDLDRDGVGELTFAYELGCHSDVSPNTLKLLLLQGETKYILRGETRVELPDDAPLGGKYKADPAESAWPRPFLEHVRKVWPRIVK